MTRSIALARPGTLEFAHTGWASDQRAVDFLEHKTFTDAETEILLGGSTPTKAGVDVGPGMALRIATVFACRRVIAEDVAKLPRFVKRTTIKNGKQRTEIVRDHPVARLLTQKPNDWMTPFELVEYLVGQAVLRKGGYCIITRDSSGEPLELLPLLPGSVSEWWDHDWGVRYQVNGYGQSFIADPGTLLTIRGPIDDTLLRGYAVSAIAREAIGRAAAVEDAVGRFHKNDLRPSGVLTTKLKLDERIRDEIRSSWNRAYGPGGTGGIAVLDSEFDFKALNATSADSQTIENRKHEIEEICRFFRVNPAKIGHSIGALGYNGLEQVNDAHKSDSIVPWIERFEQACERDLLTEDEGRDGLSVEIDVDAFLRGTFSDRVNAYGNASKVFMTPNEIRIREGLDPLDDPAMDRVQLQANNTGIVPGGAQQAKPGNGEKQPQGDAQRDGKQ